MTGAGPAGESTRALPAVLFVVEEVLVPEFSRERWQWAWRPQGPPIPERSYRAAVRRAEHRWDRQRWEALLGGEAREEAPGHRAFLRDTLREIAGYPMPESEADLFVDRFLKCPLPRPPHPEVPALLAELRRRGGTIGALGRFAGPGGSEALARAGIRPAIDVVAGSDPGGASMPAREAFRAAAREMGRRPKEITFVGTLFWSEVRAAHRAGLDSLRLARGEADPRGGTARLGRLPDLLERRVGPSTASDPEPAPPS